MQKQLLSFTVIVCFFLIAVASGGVNKLKVNSFVNNEMVETPGEGDYVITKDGAKVSGKQVEHRAGLFVKAGIFVDDQRFVFEDVKGYRKDDVFYINKKNFFIRRIIHGALNVYVMYKQVTDNSGGIHSTYTIAEYYAQEGEDGELKGLRSQKELRTILESCPEAVAMVDLSNKDMRRAMKANPLYLNEVFDLYNSGCRRSKR